MTSPIPGTTRPAPRRPPLLARSPRALPSPGPGRYEVGDLTRPRSWARLRHQLVTDGLALFDGVTDPAGLLAAAATVMTVTPHPDAGPDGVTTITDLGPAGEHPGAAGFSHRALPPHTDRSSVPTLPGLLMVTCGAAACVGGSSGLADGHAVYADLAANAPRMLEALRRPRSVLFGGSARHLGAVFTPDPARPGVPRRCRLRLRLDDLAIFSPDLTEHLPVLQAAIDRHTITITLTPGRGYLLDNHRWLHACSDYTGARTLYRVLGDPLPELGMHTGIPLEHTTPHTGLGPRDAGLHDGGVR